MTPRLSPAERRVAERVLAHPRQSAYGAVADLARAAGTSEPTVVRFCRKIGLRGFREFKLRVAEALSRPTSYLHPDVASGDGIADAVTKVVDSSIQALLRVRATAPMMPFDAASAVIATARQLVFAGLGASGNVARDASQKFFRLGIPCTAATDSPTILQHAAIARADDVLIVISNRGDWPELIRAAALAAARGVTVIALTVASAPLAAQATLLFDCDSDENAGLYTPMSSRHAHLAILDALQVAVALQAGDAAETRLKLSKQVLTPDAMQRQDSG